MNRWILLLCLSALGADPGGSTVDVIDGGLMQAATILQARTGVMVTFEGVPRDIEGLHYQVAPTPQSPLHEVRLTREALRFEVPAGATALEALEVAVAASNASPDAYARYRVASDGDALDVLPFEVRTLAGWEPYTPLLDTVVTLPSATGTATQLYRALVVALSDVSTVPVVDGVGLSALDPYWPGWDRYGALTLRSPTAPARVLLDEIIGQADYADTWRLGWVRWIDPSHRNPTEPHWVLSWDRVQPVAPRRRVHRPIADARQSLQNGLKSER